MKGVFRSSAASGDLQGLSIVETADSESVGELIEEGSALEADVVKAWTTPGTLMRRKFARHEVPEDDVPGEYLDKRGARLVRPARECFNPP